MRILSAIEYPAIPRRVVRVVEKPDDPQWVHVAADGKVTVSPRGHTGDTEAAGTVCDKCRSNWRVREFTFTREELEVGLNKWGNPVHDGQDAVSSRPRTWDELYAEVDVRLGGHADFGDAPREAAPSARPEVEPDFELVIAGDPGLDDEGVAHQRYKVLRHGEAKMVLTAFGVDRSAFEQDRAAKYALAQLSIVEAGTAHDAALAIVS